MGVHGSRCHWQLVIREDRQVAFGVEQFAAAGNPSRNCAEAIRLADEP